MTPPRAFVLAVVFAACGSPVHGTSTPPALSTSDTSTALGGTSMPAETVLWFGGDVLITDTVERTVTADDDPAERFAQVLSPTTRFIRRRDPHATVIVNQESPVARTRRRAVDAQANDADFGDGPFPRRLNAPAWVLHGLARAGIDGIGLANNHALDQTSEGLEETVMAAKGAGLRVVGAGAHPDLVRAWRVGTAPQQWSIVAAFDGRAPPVRLDDGAFSVAYVTHAEAVIRREAGAVDAVVAVVHVMGELRDRPRHRWRRWAERLARAGADAIVVHGTHVVLPVEVATIAGRRIPIVWGLGNFFADMGRRASPRRDMPALPKRESPAVHEGLMARLALGPDGIRLSVLPTWIADDRFVRYHGGLPDGRVSFWVRPLAGCGPATVWPVDWPADLRDEVARWVDHRRDGMLERLGLQPDACEPRPLARGAWRFPRPARVTADGTRRR